MENEQELKEILKEVSSAISKSLSTPETLERLEQLQQKGYQLYLVMEQTSEDMRKTGGSPIMPIQVQPADVAKSKVSSRSFELSEDDKNFLRTLKIKID